jgi:integrase/recombinase XerD
MEYIKSIKERGKYTVVYDENSKMQNKPDNRTDFGKKVSTCTINNYIRNLKAFSSYCVEYQITKTNPASKIKYLSHKRTKKEFITDGQFKMLLRSFNLSLFHEYRDFVITNLLIDTGMRISECLLIKSEDIDLIKRCILLYADNTKSKKDRYVFFSNEMNVIIKRWLKYKDIYTSSDYLFPTQKGNPIQNMVYEKNFRKYCTRIGLENVSPHTLRNNFAKRFLMNGGNIYTLSQILGHSSVTVTEQAYLDLTDDDIRENYQKFSPLARMR